jgi:hypothetical protein
MYKNYCIKLKGISYNEYISTSKLLNFSNVSQPPTDLTNHTDGDANT